MSDSFDTSPLSVRCVEVIVVDCERGTGDLRHLVRQVFDKDGMLLAEHDWLHEDPTYANFFLRSAAVRGEWLHEATVAAKQAGVFAGADVQRDRISVSTANHQVESWSSLEITLTELGGWAVKARHPFGLSFTGYFHTDGDVQKRLRAWLAELRAEAALGRNETQAEKAARVAAARQGV